MKHKILGTILVAALLVSCNKKNTEETITNQQMMDNDTTLMHNDSTTMNTESKINHTNSVTYSCPMHPEAKGNLNDKCPKCGMKLSVPEPKTSEED